MEILATIAGADPGQVDRLVSSHLAGCKAMGWVLQSSDGAGHLTAEGRMVLDRACVANPE